MTPKWKFLTIISMKTIDEEGGGIVNEKKIEELFRENEQRIYFHMRRLGIQDPNGDFFAEAQYALWMAIESYEEERGAFSTYVNAKIRNALIDYIRKINRQAEVEDSYKEQIKHHHLYLVEDSVTDEYLWEDVRAMLTHNQWKWVYYYVIHDYSVDQIASLEGVTRNAVKNWGRHARNKLKHHLAHMKGW